MKYKYALYTVIVRRGIRRVVAVDYEIYQQHLELDIEEGYEDYDFIGIIESDLKSDELIETIAEAGDSKAEYYRNRLLNISEIIKTTKM